jgi:hypothetical protein
MAAVSGLDPSVLVAPDYQTQMLQAQRRLALADALRQQALQDTPGNGGTVSWTQGLARILDAVAAKRSADKGYQQLQGANQAYAAGLRSMFGGAPQTAQGAAPSGATPPQMAPQAPQPTDPLAPLPSQPVAPPQAASPPPSAPPSNNAQPGGAPGPMNLTGNPNRDMAMYVMNPDEYGKAIIDNAAKGGTPTDTEVLVAHARDALAKGDVATATALLGNLEKQNYIAPAAARPGGWTQDPHTGQWMFHPQAPIPGAVPGPTDANGNMTWQVPEGTEAAIAERAKSQSSGEAAGKAPYQFQQVFNPQTGQMEYKPVSEMAGQGGGSLNAHYGRGQASGGSFAAGPALGQQEAFSQYGKGSANAFLETQGIANSSPQRVQSLREMQDLISGPNALATGPTAQKVQEAAEHFGLSFLAKDNAFVFNKDAARFVAQSAADLGLNGSDARLGMMANASPNMKMTPQALKTVIPTMIGLEYAKMAKATAASTWAQRDPAGNARFESTWRQNYDPRMFTAYAQGGPQALAKAPAADRQRWLREYRNLKGMGVDFTQFAQ